MFRDYSLELFLYDDVITAKDNVNKQLVTSIGEEIFQQAGHYSLHNVLTGLWR